MDARRLGESLWTIHLEHMQALDQIVNKSCIRGENGVLMYLYHVDRPLSPGDLTKCLGLTTGRVANILRQLERTGMIARKPDDGDKRRVSVALTPAGEVQARRLNAEAVRFYEQVLSRLDPDEPARFLKTLTRLVEIVSRDLEQRSIPNQSNGGHDSDAQRA